MYTTLFKQQTVTLTRVVNLFITIFLISFTTPALAVTLLYSFNSPTGNVGSSETYTTNGVSITARGYNSSNFNVSMYGKNDGGDESGLGIASSSDHEIDTTHYIQLDLANVFAQHINPNSIVMSIGSVQPGEGWALFGSNSQGNIGSLLQTGSTNFPSSFSVVGTANSYRYLSVQATGGDVLLSTFAVTAPEPATMVLIGAGALAAIYRKRAQKA